MKLVIHDICQSFIKIYTVFMRAFMQLVRYNTMLKTYLCKEHF